MIFKLIFLFFHCTHSFQILKNKEEDIPAVGNNSAIINAKVDNSFRSCRLKKNGVQVCQATWEWSITSYSLRINCTPNYTHLIFAGDGSYVDCTFLVPLLQENGDQKKFLFNISTSSMISPLTNNFIFCRFWSLVHGTDRLVPKTSRHKKLQHLSS
jgi:hypothetical protein